MDAVDERRGNALVHRIVAQFAAYEGRYLAVGQQHEFLDQFVGVFRYLEEYPGRFIVGIEGEFYFFPVECDGSGGHAPLAHLLGQGIQDEDFFAQRIVRSFDHRLSLLVGEAAVRADDRTAEPLVFHVSFLVHFKDGREGELLFVRTQGADVVAQDLGQHGNHPVHQIHRSTAVVGFVVQRSTFLDVMRNVGDVHPDEVVAVFQFVERKGIVEVLGVGRVDGKGRRVPHVAPTGDLLLGDFDGQGGGFGFDLLRKTVRKPVFGQDGVDLHFVFAGTSQDVEDTADGVVGLVGPLGDFDHDFVAVVRLADAFLGDVEIDADAVVVRDDESEVVREFQPPDELRLGAGDDLDDLAFRRPVLRRKTYTRTVSPCRLLPVAEAGM